MLPHVQRDRRQAQRRQPRRVDRTDGATPPQARDLPRYDWVITVDQSGPATAFAEVHCQIPPRYFTDYLSLVKLADGWRFVSKTYHAEIKD
jgi:putative lumazine-binding protein